MVRLKYFMDSFVKTKEDFKVPYLINGKVCFNSKEHAKLMFVFLDVLEHYFRLGWFANKQNIASFEMYYSNVSKVNISVYRIGKRFFMARELYDRIYNALYNWDLNLRNVWEITEKEFEETRCMLHLLFFKFNKNRCEL